MRSYGVAVAAYCLCAVFGLSAGCSQKAVTVSTDLAPAARLESWQDNPQSFRSHMSKVGPGWSEKQLLDHAGKPAPKPRDGWYYRSRVSLVTGGEYAWFTFTFTNGVVSAIDSGLASIQTARVPE